MRYEKMYGDWCDGLFACYMCCTRIPPHNTSSTLRTHLNGTQQHYGTV